MKNNPFSLQLLSHSEPFATHDAAIDYIMHSYKGKALMAEPALFFYGTGDDIKMIVAVGRDDNGNICLLENEQIQLNADIAAIIEAAGFERDATGKIVYKPDIHDDVLEDATSLADAIARVSEYAQNAIGSIPDYSGEIATMQSNIQNNTTEIARVEAKVDTETARAIAVENTLSERITTTNTAITEEVARAQMAELQLSNRIQSAENDLATVDTRINEKVSTAIALEQSARESADNVLQSKIDAEKDARIAADTALEDRISSSLNESKAYTDSKISDVNSAIITAKNEAISTAAADATTKANEVKTYAETIVATETARATQKENELGAAITALQTETGQINTELGEKIETVTIEKDSDNALLYWLVVDGVRVSQINIPKDQFLKDASYNPATKDIELLCETTEGERILRINVSDLVDTYTAGNGLALENGKFSVKINEDSEPYLTVGENGVKLSGIDSALNAKANKSDVYDKDYCDEHFLTDSDIDGVVTQNDLDEINESISTINTEITNIKSDISTINGNEATEGSIAYALKEAKTYTDTKVQEEYTRATTVESQINDALAIINGNEATEGSIKKALKDAKDYTDTKVLEEAQTRANEISRIDNELAGKANAQDVYTKAEIDAAGYLTSVDLSPYATSADLSNAVSAIDAVNTAQNNRLDAVEAKDVAQDNRLTNIEDELVKITVIEEDTNSIDISANKTNNGTKVKADLKLDSTQPNIIRVGGNGVYANVDLSYNRATNTLTLNNGVESKDIQLSAQTLVNSGYYDSENKQIVLVVTIDGEVSNIEIPVSDLLNILQVDNGQNNPIILRLNKDVHGVDILTATVNISNAPTNGIINDNGTLYASKSASDLTAYWGNVTVSIQQAIENLKDATETLESDVANINTEIQSMDGDIDDLRQQVATNTQNIATNTQNISTNTQNIAANARDIATNAQNIANNTRDIATNRQNIATNAQNIAANTQSINQHTTQITDLTTRVTNLESRMTAVEGDITTINGDITDIKGDIVTINSAIDGINARLDAIENLLKNGLIDFNDRNANEDLTDDTIYVNGQPW